jgi:CheY-like chemotaxis protein
VRWHCDTVGAALPSDDSIHASLETVRTALTAATTLSRSLVNFARHTRVQRRPLHWRSQLVELLPTVQRLLGQRIQLSADLGPEPGPVVHADGAQLQQVLLNLVLNSRDALQKAGTIHVQLSEDEQQAWLDVIDNGPGIAPALRPFVFEPFFTTKDSNQGTGLGLAIVQRVLHEHGGRAELRDHPGGGAWVRLWLPKWSSERPWEPSTGRPGVLLVHTVAQHRAVLAADLQQAGFNVLQAADISQAMEQLAAPLPCPSALILVEGDRQTSAAQMLTQLRSLGINAPALAVLRSDSDPSLMPLETGVRVLRFPLAVPELVMELEGLLKESPPARAMLPSAPEHADFNRQSHEQTNSSAARR